MITPNSEVSRTATVRATASELASILDRVTLDKPSNPVRVLFRNDGVSVWTHDLAKTIQVLVTDAQVPSLKVEEDCVILVDPSAFADLLHTKFGKGVLKITAKANDTIQYIYKLTA